MFNMVSYQGNEQITTRYHYTPIRTARIKNSDNTKRWWGCRQAGGGNVKWYSLPGK